MTFRPAARCGLDVGGNLRRLVGSAWSGGFYLSIAGRFGRGFLIWVKEGSLPGGRREGEMFRVCFPPTARRRAATTGHAWSGRPAYRVFGESFRRHVIVITPSRHGSCDLSSSSGALSGRGLDLSFLNSAFYSRLRHVAGPGICCSGSTGVFRRRSSWSLSFGIPLRIPGGDREDRRKDAARSR